MSIIFIDIQNVKPLVWRMQSTLPFPFFLKISKHNQKFCKIILISILIYIYKTQSLSVCMSAIEIKLETFRYKQVYESYITFSREAKHGILISIRIVYRGATSLYLFNLY